MWRVFAVLVVCGAACVWGFCASAARADVTITNVTVTGGYPTVYWTAGPTDQLARIGFGSSLAKLTAPGQYPNGVLTEPGDYADPVLLHLTLYDPQPGNTTWSAANLGVVGVDPLAPGTYYVHIEWLTSNYDGPYWSNDFAFSVAAPATPKPPPPKKKPSAPKKKPTSAVAPHLKVSVHHTHLSDSSTNFYEDTLLFVDSGTPCDPAVAIKGTGSGPPMTLFLTTRGRTYKASQKHLCTTEPPFGSATGNVPWGLSLPMDAPDGFEFDPLTPGTWHVNETRQTFSYRFYEAGRFLGKGRFLVHWNVSGGARQIWMGTDDFVNICINKLKQIRSQGGKLYCYDGKATNYSSIKLL